MKTNFIKNCLGLCIAVSCLDTVHYNFQRSVMIIIILNDGARLQCTVIYNCLQYIELGPYITRGNYKNKINQVFSFSTLALNIAGCCAVWRTLFSLEKKSDSIRLLFQLILYNIVTFS